jgi:tetratricopeptide (TPR) repeat protein
LRVERDAPKAIALMKETVARYPREKELHRTLGTLLIGRDPDTAIAEFQAALSLDPDYGVVHNELAFALVAKDDYAGAQAHLERYAALAPGEFNPFDSLGLVLFLRGRLDEARANFEKAGAINPRLGEEGPVAYILALQEDFDGAIDLLDRFAANVWADGPRSEGPAWQGVFLYVTGRRRAAFERLESGLRLAVSSHSNVREGAIHLIRGFLRADMGEIDRAREDFRSARTVLEPLGSAPRLAWRTGFIYSDIRAGAFEDADKGMAEIDKMAPAEARSPMLAATLRYYRFLTFAGRGESEEAFREAEGPRPYQVPMSWNFNIPSLAAGNLPVTMDEVAQARARAGLLDEAIEEYRALMTVSPETHLRRLINPLYHFRVAGLYEKKGVRSEAVRHYRRFLELWKDADPELPEPGMARERLAALER